MRRFVVAVVFLLAACPGAVQAQGVGCTFTLGFAALHDLIPDVVGNCVGNEVHNTETGDALQQTTNGLLVWRKLDNWTVFTDGSTTWLNGPLGLQQRSNETRFWWETNADQLPILPPPTPGDRCHTAGLSLDVVNVDVGAGNLVGTFRFTNTSGVSCTLFGYPGAQLLDAAGNPLPTTLVRSGGYFRNEPSPADVSLGPTGTAIFRIHWEQVPVGNETTCPMAQQLAVTPPDEFNPIVVAIGIRACGGGRLDITPVRPDA